MTTTAAKTPERGRLLTIGAVCRRLKSEFSDISISKIRYLEDQGLLTPQRTRGGYRLFGEEDVERLQLILRLQRDEFLPLRVIRQELAQPGGKERKRRRPVGLGEQDDMVGLGELCERAAVDGLLEAHSESGERVYAEADVEIAAACAKLATFGVAPRHLRTFRTSSDREAGLLEALVAPALRARSAERRAEGLQDLQTLAELAQELSQLLFWRGVRQLAS